MDLLLKKNGSTAQKTEVLTNIKTQFQQLNIF